MGIISEIGRKHMKVRLLIASISIALIIGAITMIYPFALMISGSSKTGVDLAETLLIPSFLTNEESMYRKSVEAIFNETATMFQSAYSIHNGDFKQLEMPAEKDINRKLVNDWNKFIKGKNYKQYYYGLSFIQFGISRNSIPINLRRFKSMLSKRFDGSLADMNKAMQLDLASWQSVRIDSAKYLTPRIMPNSETELYRTYYTFKEKFFDGSQKDSRLVNRYFINPEGYFKTVYLRAQYTRKIGNYNASHKTNYKSWDEVKLTRFYPANKKKYTDIQRSDWEDFVRTLLNRFWIIASPKALPNYHSYLQAKYGNKIALLNKMYGTKYKSFKKIKLLTQLKEFPFFGARLSDWNAFISGWKDAKGKEYKIPIEYVEVTGAIYDFRSHLKNKYKTIAKANKYLKTNYKDWSDIKGQQQASHYLWIKKNSNALKQDFLMSM